MRSDAVRVGQRGTIVIPATLRQRLGIDEGSFLLVVEREGGLLLRPAVVAAVDVLHRSPPKSARDLLREKREEIRRVAASHGAHNVRLFGSTARGEDRPRSDLDFIVEMEEGRSLLDLVGLQQDLGELLGREVDVITDEGVSPHLRDRIYAEAVLL